MHRLAIAHGPVLDKERQPRVCHGDVDALAYEPRRLERGIDKRSTLEGCGGARHEPASGKECTHRVLVPR
jgi:hypothetical protein